CTPAGSSATSSMKTDETISTITMLAGVAAVGAGVFLVFSNAGETSSPAGAVRVSLGFVGSGVRAQASW
ncbi:MAG TPA: hypothetical protein VKU41_17670, partial [Polyangiaceae bacterium]|nr:hypothetical protein [Polyangiaceae bacterium]